MPFEKITGDPANYFEFHPFVGIISHIGAFLWCTSSITCFYTGYYLRSISKGEESNFLLFSGVFSFILLIDDFFMFHDDIFYSIYSLTLEPFIFLTYALLLLYFIYKFYRIIFQNNYILLGTAGFFLGASIFLDLFFKSEGLQYFFEDSLKFIGIVSWTLFFVPTSYKLLQEKASGSAQ